MKLIFPHETGIAIFTPSDSDQLGEIAAGIAPAGVPYRYVDDAFIPQDREFRNAWEADFSNPDGYGIGPDAWHAEKEAEEVAYHIVEKEKEINEEKDEKEKERLRQQLNKWKEVKSKLQQKADGYMAASQQKIDASVASIIRNKNATKSISISMDKAREITKERLRREREPLLADLDVQFMRNLEMGVDNAAVVAEKQRLRDITAAVDFISDPEEMKKIVVKLEL